jgi:hypothetical protein
MAIKRVSNTAKSRGTAQKKDVAPHGPSATRNPGRSRAQRNDTGEARQQQRRAPKTHPLGRTPGAQRKDHKGTAQGMDLR